jgi:transcriptional regulator with PAS, ATPase and Fis domain
LRKRGLELTLVEQRPADAAAFAALASHDQPAGAGLAVFAPELTPPERALVEIMLNEAALDVDAALRERDEPSSEPPGRRTSYHGIIGAATPMQDLYTLLDRAAPSDSTVLIQGENGTGKELVARAIHVGSERRDRKFVVTNCSAFNDNLLDSELFGHKRGAFTGAVADKAGLFETADAGTFFLDEIGDMSPTLQVKVLRVLQEGTFNRVGDADMRKVDVRIIAATNRDLGAMVAAGQFREDLYYRIHVIHVQLPALRERRDDIPLLIEHFLARHRRQRPKRLTPECAARMFAYPWPGNVRELENEIERLVVLAGDEPLISADLLSPRIRQWAPAEDAADETSTASLPAAIEALEKRMIGAAMRRHGGNKTRAADELRVSRRNLIRLVQKYQLE